MQTNRCFIVLATLLTGGSSLLTAAGASCEALAQLSVPKATITVAQHVPAGPFTAPGGNAAAPGGNESLQKLPEFCRFAATLKPTEDSDIKIEVWMPVTAWNGKFQAVGNGGWAGAIGYAAMATALESGYATAGTDTGHSGGGASFALGHPEKVVDYAYRSEHEMTVAAKTVIASYYGQNPKYSYWNGCSSGGKQALKEAQRFPDDFDGIIAGSATGNWTGRAAQSIWIAQALHNDEASYIPPTKYALIHKAVVEACDALDGVKDGVLEDPRRCHFDPAVLECKTSDTQMCLTPPQVEAARRIYADTKNPRTGKVIAPGLEPGSEMGWANLGGPRVFAIGDDYFKFVVFSDPKWDYRTFDFDQGMARAEALDGDRINALDTNLTAFFKHGGRLLQYHGWSDQQIAPRNSVNYYNAVLETMGGVDKVNDSYRLFMVPGMGHCRGLEGTDNFDMVGTLETWVEKGKAPERIVATRVRDGKVDRARPLCVYPKVAVYQKTGSTDDASNFSCQLP
jgi:feruloyl esterase